MRMKIKNMYTLFSFNNKKQKPIISYFELNNGYKKLNLALCILLLYYFLQLCKIMSFCSNSKTEPFFFQNILIIPRKGIN